MNTDAIIIEKFIQDHDIEAAQALEKIVPDKLAAFFNDTSSELSQEVIPLMNPHLMSTVFELMQQEKVVQLFEFLEIHHIVLSVRMMKKDLADIILNGLPAEKSTSIRRLLKYLENSVGSHMDPTVLTLSENMTVKEAMTEARKHEKKIQPDLFVLTSDRRLKGVIKLSEMIAKDPETEIRSIMNTKIATLPPETPIQSILYHQEWTEYYSLPVVDQTSLFLGAIRLETVRSILVKSDKKIGELNQTAINALGELYQIGLSGIFKSATDFNSGLSKD